VFCSLIFTLRRIPFFGDQIDEEKVGKASVAHWNYMRCVQKSFIGNLKGRDLLEDLGLSGSLITIRFLK
jgi:hypothetical protein